MGNDDTDTAVATLDVLRRRVAELEQADAARQQAEDRLRFLAEASEIIAGSLDYEETLARVASLAVPFLADWCIVYLCQPDGSIHRLAMEHADSAHEPVSATIQQDFPMNPDATEGVPLVIRTGNSLLYPEATPEILAADALDPDGLRSVASNLGVQSWICVPLAVSGTSFGAISCMTAESGRRYGPADLALAEDLGRRAAVAVENARLYGVEQTTRQQAERNAERIGRLQDVTAALSQAVTPEQVAEVIVNQGLASLGAQRGMVATLSDDGQTLHVIQSQGHVAEVLDSWQSFPVDAPVPAAEAVRTGEPVLIASPAEHAARYPNLARERGITGTGALASAPMIVGDRILGAIGLSFTQPRSFDDDDRDFLLALARQCAQALDRARAYADARAAVRAREQFLSIASHELKTPLTSIKAAGQLIDRRLNEEQLDRSQLVWFSDQMRGEINRLELLVNDLLDASRIQQGRLDLRPARTDLVDLARVVVGRFEYAPIRLPEHTLVIEADAPVVGVFDPARIDQVITNLVSNALKYSPAGGEVRVRVTASGDIAMLTVSDSGIGLTEAEQAGMFQPFMRGDGVREHIGGTGLGLFISAEIVERHGGSVVVESVPGHGTTFFVYLPLTPADAD